MLEYLINPSAKNFLQSVYIAELQYHLLTVECEKLNDRYIVNPRYNHHQKMMVMYLGLLSIFPSLETEV